MLSECQHTMAEEEGIIDGGEEQVEKKREVEDMEEEESRKRSRRKRRHKNQKHIVHCKIWSKHLLYGPTKQSKFMFRRGPWVKKPLSYCYAGSHVQVELLCGMLNLADTPEETLPKLCSCLLALSPELSYSAASAVIKSLLLGKVISMMLISIQTYWLAVC